MNPPKSSPRFPPPPTVSSPEPAFLAGFREPTDRVHLFLDGQGAWLRDATGRQFLDFSSQYWNVNLGHKNPAMTQPLQEALEQHLFVNLRFGHTPATARLARRLVDLGQGRFPAVQFMTCGSMAVEAAIKIARQLTGRQDILSFRQAYHGMSYGALWCTGYDAIVLPFGDRDPRHRLAHPYRCVPCPFRTAYPQCGVRCAREVIRTIKRRRRRLAAVVAEPVISNQVIVPPEEFWPEVSRACREHEVLLIADEAVCGMGRCGHWLGSDLVGMDPDMIALGKGMTGGYLPMAALLHGPRTAAAFQGKTLLHGQTFDGYDLGAEATLALIAYLEENDLLRRVRERGALLKACLLELQRKLPAIVDVRGWGLLWGIELSPEAVPEPELGAFARSLQNALQDEGILLGGLGRVQILAPPFIVSEDEIALAIERIEAALRKVLYL